MSTEKTVAREFVSAAIEKGWLVSVHDGVEWVVRNSKDVDTVTKALCSTGEDTIMFRAENEVSPETGRDVTSRRVGQLYLIWGNDPSGEELVADYSANPDIEALWNEVMGRLFGM